MKKIAVILGVIVLSLSFLKGLSLAADKFAYVDLSRVFAEYGKTKDYDKALTSKEAAYNTDRDKKINEIKQLQDKVDLLSDKEKEAKRPELENKIKTLQDFDRQKQTDLRKEQDEKMKEVFKDIDEAIKNYAGKEGFTLVFNDRVLLYQNKSLDISDKIIDIVNKGYSAKK